MDTFETILFAVQGSVAHITLNRPEAHNALSNQMVEELLRCVSALRDEATYLGLRALVLRSSGATFCTGGDLRDMMNSLPREENRAAIARVDELLRAVNELPLVVIARVQGAAMGGGLGLVCVSDIAVAGYSATFGLPEVRLGIVPSMISPYVVARVGFTRARHLMLIGGRLDYMEAYEYCLIQHYCADNELDVRVNAVLNDVLKCAPGALRETKRLLNYLRSQDETLSYRVDLLQRLTSSEEARQGVQAFLEKTSAPWVQEP
ncbi:MAG TPA: enoyl-CoA hydratase-related protein [Ktedonobacterales bacterium]|jgi:enoyl-CoA hydratase/carnithine racemase|nr:enoyl-CoA hydratase-related protein [Ktedonobacterales bacterium]